MPCLLHGWAQARDAPGTATYNSQAGFLKYPAAPNGWARGQAAPAANGTVSPASYSGAGCMPLARLCPLVCES